MRDLVSSFMTRSPIDRSTEKVLRMHGRSIVVIKENAADPWASQSPSRLKFKFMFANAELSSSSKRSVACLHLVINPIARYSVFLPMYIRRQAATNRSRIYVH